MKLISWNVNGIRACMNKGFLDFFKNMDADVFAIQETKMQECQADIAIDGYYHYMNSAIKKGYSGTLVYTKVLPLSVKYDFDIEEHSTEGRVITLEYENFYFVTVYTPNSQDELKRLDYRMKFEDDFRNYLINLNKLKPVILCGDLNVAHQPIDLKNPSTNTRNAGFTIEERDKFSLLLNNGFVDSFRYLYPDKVEYSWWSYRFFAREKNIGWRIDYFVVSDKIKNQIKDSLIHKDILGSDHAPVMLEIDL